MDRCVRLAAVIILVVAGACAAPEVLLPLSTTVPDGVDFSGTWKIREAGSADQHRVNQAVRRTDGSSTSGKGRRATSSNNRSGQVNVFLRMARTFKISQTPYGFFISLDRSVVQELRFGENRQVSVGEIVAQRVSGWEGPVYVVETLDKKGMKLTERYWLNSERNVLHREITFRSRNKKTETMVQLFDRA
jgi:hypothetical protein